MALIAAHLNAGGHSVAIGIYIISFFPHLHTPSPLLPVPNKLRGFYGR